MTLLSEVAGRRLRLPRAQTRDLVVERDLCVAMDDGVVLLADRYSPRGAGPMPTVLVRSPYGRRSVIGLIHGRLYAERGLQAVVQSVRGTFGSGGEFNAFDERTDGLATIAWLRRQPWHAGAIGMAGMSYLGLVQWAVARDAGDALGALSPAASASQLHGVTHGGGLALQTAASWVYLVGVQEQRLAWLRVLGGLRRIGVALEQLPLGELDARLLGASSRVFQESLRYTAIDEPYWAARDFTAGVAEIVAPVQLVAGWFDLFTPWELDDFVALRRAGRRAQLVVGPWAHTSDGLFATAVRESIAWLRAHLLGDSRLLADAPVRVHVGGSGEWRDLSDWPPPGARDWCLFLHPHGKLGLEPAAPSEPDRYRYDPADPTPSLGGPTLLGRRPVVDNAPLERRPDVLTFTTPVLERSVEVIGPVRADVRVRSSLEHFDVFVRVCDVDATGVSRNVCDALERVAPERFPRDADGVTRVEFALWPAAHRFIAGHRLRVQVSSGAHPRYARNLGTGEPLATGIRMVAADQEVFHDPTRPSAVVLSVVGPTP
jgi:uncharacterized protein